MKSYLLIFLVFVVMSAKDVIAANGDIQSTIDDASYDECVAPNSTKGFTVLCKAIMKGDRTAVSVLYILGDLDFSAKCGNWQLWHLAAAFGRMSILNDIYGFLRTSEIFFDTDDHNCTVLHFAARNGHAGTVYDLLNTIRGEDRVVKTAKGYTAYELFEYALEFNV